MQYAPRPQRCCCRSAAPPCITAPQRNNTFLSCTFPPHWRQSRHPFSRPPHYHSATTDVEHQMRLRARLSPRSVSLPRTGRSTTPQPAARHVVLRSSSPPALHAPDAAKAWHAPSRWPPACPASWFCFVWVRIRRLRHAGFASPRPPAPLFLRSSEAAVGVPAAPVQLTSPWLVLSTKAPSRPVLWVILLVPLASCSQQRKAPGKSCPTTPTARCVLRDVTGRSFAQVPSTAASLSCVVVSGAPHPLTHSDLTLPGQQA